MIVHVEGCARCGLDHNELLFSELNNARDEYAYWAMCPVVHQPILLAIVENTFFEADDTVQGR